MRKYLARRLVALVPVIIGVTFAVFMMLNLMPVDPIMMMITEISSSQTPLMPHEVTEERYEAMRKEMGLDRPLLVQYGSFLSKAIQGDLGRSFQTRRTVLDMIVSNAPPTVALAVAGLGIAVCWGSFWASLRPCAGVLGLTRR